VSNPYPYLVENVIACFFALGVALVLLLATGCGAQADYVEADRLTYEAVAPIYLNYTDDDPELAKPEKERRHRLVRSWAARIKRAEAASE
jgi:hypothetical protein